MDKSVLVFSNSIHLIIVQLIQFFPVKSRFQINEISHKFMKKKKF